MKGEHLDSVLMAELDSVLMAELDSGPASERLDSPAPASEKNIQTRILIELGKNPQTRLFRNNVGRGICISASGPKYTAILNAVIALVARMGAKASPVSYGLFVGSGDLAGWREITITPDMVGKKIAQFASVECKTPTGKIEPAQVTWAHNVRNAGGLAIVARSVEEAVAGMRNSSLDL